MRPIVRMADQVEMLAPWHHPVRALHHYLTDDLMQEYPAQWSSQWAHEHPDPGPPEDEADFAEWIYRNLPDTEWHDLPFPTGRGKSPREDVLEYFKNHRRPNDDLGLTSGHGMSLRGFKQT